MICRSFETCNLYFFLSCPYASIEYDETATTISFLYADSVIFPITWCERHNCVLCIVRTTFGMYNLKKLRIRIVTDNTKSGKSVCECITNGFSFCINLINFIGAKRRLKRLGPLKSVMTRTFLELSSSFLVSAYLLLVGYSSTK